MKIIFKKIIIKILTLESKLVLKRFKPKIIAITGSVGKTSAKDAIYNALKDNLHIRKNQKSFNSDIGTPLTILGLQNGWSDPVFWLKNIFVGATRIFSFKYPEWLVLEIGVDRPGDIEKITKWIKPDVVVITTFPTIPAHVEAFETPEAVIAEKTKLVLAMKKDGFLILNADDERVMKTASLSKGTVYTYGIKEKGSIQADNVVISTARGDSWEKPTGMSIHIDYGDSSVPLLIHGGLGVQHIYPILSALAVGVALKVPFLSLVQSFGDYTTPAGRMRILSGMKDSVIIDDTYNSSPIAFEKAIDVFSQIKSPGKKILIIGDMLELGKFSSAEHKKAGILIGKMNPEFLVTVGPRSMESAQEAISAGMKEEKIFQFKNSTEAGMWAKDYVEKGDVVLVKGSQGMRMEKVVEKILLNKERQIGLLVRQDSVWKNI